jgi:hypothetical protein
MNADSLHRPQRFPLLWLGPLLILAIPCSVCNLLQSTATPPTLTPSATIASPTYTYLPIDTPSPAQTPSVTATFTPTPTATLPPPPPTLAATFTPRPPTPTIAHSDIDLVTLLYYSPSGVVFFGLKNNGPADLIHETIKLTCSGFEFRRCTQGKICFSPAIPINVNDSVGSAIDACISKVLS